MSVKTFFKGLSFFFIFVVLRSWALFGEEKLCFNTTFLSSSTVLVALQCSAVENAADGQLPSPCVHAPRKAEVPTKHLSLESCLEKGTAQNSSQDQNFIL